MGILGRIGCKEDTDYDVEVYFNDDEEPIVIVEQVNEDEAKKVFEEF